MVLNGVYPVRWENKAGKSGYSPACTNKWKPRVCDKPRVKCTDCTKRSLIPLSEQTIYDHLTGKHTISVYPLLNDDKCYFLATDFDKADWREDILAFAQSCRELDVPLANRLIRLAAFQNPEFYKAQAMRFPVWDKPRIIGCAENYPKHIALPRDCLEAVQELLRDNNIHCELKDERFAGNPIDIDFRGTLRADQEKAANAMLKHDIGILCAPTAFEKTITAAALIARRSVNTLILVHRTELLKQWKERLQSFLNVEKNNLGTMGYRFTDAKHIKTSVASGNT